MDTLPDDDSGATTETVIWTNGRATWRVLRCADGSRVALRYDGEAAQMGLVVRLPDRPDRLQPMKRILIRANGDEIDAGTGPADECIAWREGSEGWPEIPAGSITFFDLRHHPEREVALYDERRP